MTSRDFYIATSPTDLFSAWELGNEKFVLIPSFFLSFCFAPLGYSQVLPFSGNRELALSRTDVRTTPVAAGSKTSVTFTADPSSGGGDVFDIRVDNPFLAISLVLPGGAEVTSSNAATLGFNYTVFGVSGAGPLDPRALGAPGTHTLITLPASQPPGVYRGGGRHFSSRRFGADRSLSVLVERCSRCDVRRGCVPYG